ncbi:MAG: sialate O-acetylesterase [Akkermansiaceae bacterium]|nr:sialate O-acetylesterase [Akkermansiaceae bacterium]
MNFPIRILSLSLLAILPALAAPEKWDDDPNGIKVFILAGQSNMVGYGKTETGGNPEWTPGDKSTPKEIKGGVGCLRHLAVHDDQYPEYDFSSLLENPEQPASSPWKKRPDVKVWWRDGHSGKLGGGIRKGDLGPPFQGGNGKWFGPEYAFGQVLGDYYKDHDVLIIKTAWGGHSLAGNFRPPSAVEKRGGEVGASYKAMFEYTRECLDQLGEHFPEWKGKGYQIVGFGWHQGFNDRVSKDPSAEYHENLPDFIADVRKEFGKPELPFVIASTGMAPKGGVEMPPYSGYSEVERAQLWAGTEPPQNVLSADTRPFWREAKDAVSTMGYHWNHSGYSYFMVGKVLGDRMVQLLEQ